MSIHPIDYARIGQSTLRRLRRAGWYEGRNVWAKLNLPAKIVVFEKAKQILTEFGNLRFSSSSGSTVMEAVFGDEIANEIHEYNKIIGQELYPIAIVEGGDTAYILIGQDGIVFALAGWLEPMASCFEQAIRYLAEVYEVNEREQEADLRSVGLFGKTWTLH